MVDQALDALNELIRFWTLNMLFECRFIDPERMKPEQRWVSDGTIDFNAKTARLGAHAGHGVTQLRRDCFFFSFNCMKAGKDSDFHLITWFRG